MSSEICDVRMRSQPKKRVGNHCGNSYFRHGHINELKKKLCPRGLLTEWSQSNRSARAGPQPDIKQNQAVRERSVRKEEQEGWTRGEDDAGQAPQQINVQRQKCMS